MSKRWLGLLLLGVWLRVGVAHAALMVADDPLAIGNVVIGGPGATKSTLLTATMNTPNVTVVGHSGDQCSEFSIEAPTGTITINGGNSVTVTVKLTPLSPGTKSCVIDVKQGMTVATSFTATGTGIAPKITPTAPTFPDTD